MPAEDVKDVPPSPTKKRKNEEPHEQNGLPAKIVANSKAGTAGGGTKPGKRARVSYSCSECHRRKQKVCKP